MATNHYFDQFTFSPEQNLLVDLTIESIKIYGHDFIYMPRETLQRDDLFGEDLEALFDDNYMLEMYIETVDGFEGSGETLAKFGMQIVDTATLIVAKRRFEEVVCNKDRPMEGDLVYFPMSHGIFEVNFVEHENPFYQLGKLHSYKLTIELYTHDHDKFQTGKPNIDRIETDRGNGPEMGRADNEDIQTESEDILNGFAREENAGAGKEQDDFDEGNPFGDL